MLITRERAMCMFLHMEYNYDLAIVYLNKMEKFAAVDICYEVDYPNIPMLLSIAKINSDPTTYVKYTGKNKLLSGGIITID